MVNFLKDPDKFQIIVSCSAFDLLKHSQASKVQKIFLFHKQKQKMSLFAD